MNIRPTDRLIRVCGIDPSLRNWGMAIGEYHVDNRELTIKDMGVINPVLPTGKQVRVNSADLEAAYQLYTKSLKPYQHAQAVFVEVPVGSQSSRAMASYGICIGVLSALKASGIPFYEVTPTQVKLAGAGKKTATKDEMINWALAQHPEADWPTYTSKKLVTVSRSKAEHLADAIAAIHAGIDSDQFQQLLSLIDK